MRVLLMTGAVAAAIVSLAPAASARSGTGPWCAIVNQGFGAIQEECYYGSVEECRRTILAGNRGTCTQNPEWAYYQREKKPRRVRQY